MSTRLQNPNAAPMSPAEIRKMLDAHAAWLRGEGGARADLAGANLAGANFAGADLSYAILGKAKLTGADLTGAILGCAVLTGADLAGASLANANLGRSVLRGTKLTDANLTGADLTGADLRGAMLSGATMPWGVVHAGGETLAGTAGGYWWCAHATEGGPWLAYGCQRHPLTWWLDQDLQTLAARHGDSPEKGRIIAAVVEKVSSVLGGAL